MAFLITAQPFAIDPIKIGAILVPANILLAIMAMVWQWHEAKRQIELEKQKQALRKAAEDLAAANVKLEGQLKDFDNAAIGLFVGVKIPRSVEASKSPRYCSSDLIAIFYLMTRPMRPTLTLGEYQ